jgi:hypothetical protein
MIHNKTYKIADFGLAKMENTAGNMYLFKNLGQRHMSVLLFIWLLRFFLKTITLQNVMSGV